MYEIAIKILKNINNNGFEAYIVGGYPRNKYLGIPSMDIDICTSATPNDIASLFSNVDMTYASYGSVRLKYDDYSYEITTFRRDKSMLDGNRSYPVEYVNSLEEDLLRRDFIVNTLCINHEGDYVDYLGARNDIDNKVIHTVKESSVSFKEDPLRMLRAVRFSTTLSFSLSDEICVSLNEMKHLLSNLSFYRVKQELDLIFSSTNSMTGISYLKEYGIDEVLSLELANIKYCSNYLGIWAQCSFCEDYPFSSKEKELIDKIRFVLSSNPTFAILYEYGISICKLIDEINDNTLYQNLYDEIPIHNRDDIDIDKEFIISNVPPQLISMIYKKIESEILDGNLLNEKEYIERYILDNI